MGVRPVHVKENSVIRKSCFFAVFLLTFAGSARAEYQTMDRIAAVVDDQIILASDVEQELVMQVMQRGGDPAKLTQAQREEYTRQTLELLIRSKILAYKAKRDTLKVDEEQVEEAVRQQMQQVKEENPNFQDMLKAQNLTERELRDRYRKNLREQFLTQQVQQKLVSKVEVSYRDVQAFRQTYRDSLPPQVGLSHIVIKPKAGDVQRAEARKKADGLLARVKAGEGFAGLARQYSEDTGSAKEGGDLGFFGKGNMVPEFEKVAFALKPGEISDVVESPFGFHVIKCEGVSEDKVHARHILILLRPSEGDWQKAYNLANELKERALKGEKFSGLAQQYSEEKETAQRGGFVSFVRREALLQDKDLGKVVSVMRLGDVAGPVKFEDGWHVIKLNDDREAIESLLRQIKLTELFEKTIEETRRKMYVDVRMDK